MMKRIAPNTDRTAHVESIRALVAELARRTAGLPANIQFTSPMPMWPGEADTELIVGMHTCATPAHPDYPDAIANNMVLHNGWAEWTATCIFDAEHTEYDADVTERLQLLIEAVKSGAWVEADAAFVSIVAQLDNMVD